MKKIALALAALTLCAFPSCSSSKTSSDDNINPLIKDKNYPDAHPHRKDIVISPYKPYNLINVKGIDPGHFARDMSTAEIGANGKPVESTAKIFRVPSEKKDAAPAN